MNKKRSRQLEDRESVLEAVQRNLDDDRRTSLRQLHLPGWPVGRPKSDPQEIPLDVLAIRGLNKVEEDLHEIKTLVKKYRDDHVRLNTASAEISNNVEKQSREIDKSAKRLRTMSSQMKNEKLQSIQILALFVAFFTFVSVEFQFFSVARSPELIVALTLILLSSLMLFVSLTFLGLAYYSAAGQEDSKGSALRFNKIFLFWVSGVAAASLLACAFYAHSTYSSQRGEREENCKSLVGDIRRELDNTDSKHVDFLKEVYSSECSQ